MADDKLNQSDIDALIAKVRGTSPASQPTNDSPELTQFEKLGITENDLKGLTKLFKTGAEKFTVDKKTGNVKFDVEEIASGLVDELTGSAKAHIDEITKSASYLNVL